MRYQVECLDCGFERKVQTKKEAEQIRRDHRKNNPCDWFLEIGSNVLIKRYDPISNQYQAPAVTV